ncbi:MAG: hypothetical protein HYV09_13765 [Deltaproteobacteria bacterium]|nr:hypothetical protein [Deltaproteobacteria bacterium]
MATLDKLRRVAREGARWSREGARWSLKGARLAKLSLFVALGAASAIVAACGGGGGTQTPPHAPEVGADTGTSDAAATDDADGSLTIDAGGFDATGGDARADTLWDVPYE